MSFLENFIPRNFLAIQYMRNCPVYVSYIYPLRFWYIPRHGCLYVLFEKMYRTIQSAWSYYRVHTHTHARTHARTHAHIHTYTHAHTYHTYTHAHTHIHTRSHMHTHQRVREEWRMTKTWNPQTPSPGWGQTETIHMMRYIHTSRTSLMSAARAHNDDGIFIAGKRVCNFLFLLWWKQNLLWAL